jgi:hypothetical protein
MRVATIRIAFGLFLVCLFAVSCSNSSPSGPSTEASNKQNSRAKGNKFGEWVKGNQMDIRLTVVRDGELELPQIDIKNHSKYGIDIVPCYYLVEYQEGKVLEGTTTCDGTGIIVGPNDTLTGFATLYFNNGEIVVGPKGMFKMPTDSQMRMLKWIEVQVGKKPELEPERFIFER